MHSSNLLAVIVLLSIPSLTFAQIFDRLPDEVLSPCPVVPRKVVWERSLVHSKASARTEATELSRESIARYEEAVELPPERIRGSKGRSRDSEIKRLDQRRRDSEEAIQILATNEEFQRVLVDRDGLYTVHTDSRHMLSTYHEDRRPLNEVRKRMLEHPSLGVLTANNFPNFETTWTKRGVTYRIPEITQPIGGGRVSSEKLAHEIRKELLWCGIVDPGWDSMGSVSKLTENGALTEMTITKGSGKRRVEFVFRFDDHERPRVQNVTTTIGGKLIEEFEFVGWPNSEGCSMPMHVTKKSYDLSTGELDSTETRTLVSAENIDPNSGSSLLKD
jgi:hypothetical protein